MSFSDIEKNIGELGNKAEWKNNNRGFTGSTFTITNGGIYGSMLSTILNPPQSAVPSIHNIIERPVVINGNVSKTRYVFSIIGSHRMSDGKEAVSFLKIVKILRAT